MIPVTHKWKEIWRKITWGDIIKSSPIPSAELSRVAALHGQRENQHPWVAASQLKKLTGQKAEHIAGGLEGMCHGSLCGYAGSLVKRGIGLTEQELNG